MNRYMRRVLAAYLASAAISIAPGISASMLPAMEDFPMKLVDGILDEMLDAEMPSDEKLKVLASIATDKRAEVRIRVCDLLAQEMDTFETEALTSLLEQLSSDRDPSVRNELRHAIAGALQHTDVMTRTAMVAEWALSDSKSLRYLLATALQEDFFCLGLTSVLAHLAEDSNFRVRRAAVEVAVSRMTENPVSYQRILKRLAHDSRAEIRHVAESAIDSLRQRNYGWCT